MRNFLKRLFSKNGPKNPNKIKPPQLLSEVMEYIYIDVDRLNIYFDQLVSQKKTQELLSAKTTFGITKIETEMSAQDYITEFNLSEKIISIFNAYRSEFPIYEHNSTIEWRNFITSPIVKSFFFTLRT